MPRRLGAASLLLGCLAGCDDGSLRGSIANSADGKTYLLVADDQDGCAVSVDGKPWPTRPPARRPIAAGTHVIACGEAEIEFDIPEGVVFTFDYWGP